jgi:hypothetical protein
MSRSSEIRSQRYKASRQRQQMQQEMYAAQQQVADDDYDEDGGAGSYGASTASAAVNPENVLPLNNPNETFNMLSLLVSSIRSTPYYKARCSKINSFNELVDEIYLKVTHLEVFDMDTLTVGQKKANHAISPGLALY